jgi:hypothetical protein
MKLIVYGILLIHSLPTPQFTKNVNKTAGIVWLLAFVLFLLAAGLLFIQNAEAIGTLLCAISLSQFLVIVYWHDAKWGTLPNILSMAWAVTQVVGSS